MLLFPLLDKFHALTADYEIKRIEKYTLEYSCAGKHLLINIARAENNSMVLDIGQPKTWNFPEVPISQTEIEMMKQRVETELVKAGADVSFI
jgi:hypothetical protein